MWRVFRKSIREENQGGGHRAGIWQAEGEGWMQAPARQPWCWLFSKIFVQPFFISVCYDMPRKSVENWYLERKYDQIRKWGVEAVREAGSPGDCAGCGTGSCLLVLVPACWCSTLSQAEPATSFSNHPPTQLSWTQTDKTLIAIANTCKQLSLTSTVKSEVWQCTTKYSASVKTAGDFTKKTNIASHPKTSWADGMPFLHFQNDKS